MELINKYHELTSSFSDEREDVESVLELDENSQNAIETPYSVPTEVFSELKSAANDAMALYSKLSLENISNPSKVFSQGSEKKSFNERKKTVLNNAKAYLEDQKNSGIASMGSNVNANENDTQRHTL